MSQSAFERSVQLLISLCALITARRLYNHIKRGLHTEVHWAQSVVHDDCKLNCKQSCLGSPHPSEKPPNRSLIWFVGKSDCAAERNQNKKAALLISHTSTWEAMSVATALLLKSERDTSTHTHRHHSHSHSHSHPQPPAPNQQKYSRMASNP